MVRTAHVKFVRDFKVVRNIIGGKVVVEENGGNFADTGERIVSNPVRPTAKVLGEPMLCTAARSPDGISEHVLRADDVLSDFDVSADRSVHVVGTVVIQDRPKFAGSCAGDRAVTPNVTDIQGFPAEKAIVVATKTPASE
jgi:hypothetical protein